MSDEPSVLTERRGLLASVQHLLATIVDATETRLRILSTEIQEERIRITRLAIWGATCLFAFFLCIAMFSVFLVVLLWDSHRLTVLALLGGFFFAVGVAAALWMVAQSRGARGVPLQETLGVLDEDRARLEEAE